MSYRDMLSLHQIPTAAELKKTTEDNFNRQLSEDIHETMRAISKFIIEISEGVKPTLKCNELEEGGISISYIHEMRYPRTKAIIDQYMKEQGYTIDYHGLIIKSISFQ